MSKPARPEDGTSGKWGWHQAVHDFLVDPLLDAAGDLAIPPEEVLPAGGTDGQVLTKDGTQDGAAIWDDPTGEPGPAGIEWEGEWDSQTEYPSRSAVRHDGSLWLADGTASAGDEPGVAPVWVLLVAQGPQGDQVELQTSDTHIQWRYEGGTWQDLIALSDLEGEKGDTGDAWDAWRGDWDTQTSYAPLDTVQHQGSSWIATAANSDSEPSTPNTDWDLVAASAEFENANLSDLNDVDTSGASSGDALVYDGTSWGPGAGVPESLDDITDVEVPAPADGESLVWNDAESRWEAAERVTPQTLDNATDGLASEQYVDDQVAAAGVGAEQRAIDAEQNVRLWQLEADLLGSVESMDGWQGDAFLAGQDSIDTLTGDLLVERAVRLQDGSVQVSTGVLGAWSSETSGVSDAIYGAGYGDGLWVLVGAGGLILTSPDRETWTSQTSGTSENLRQVHWHGGLWVAVGDNGTVLTSSDGQSWTSQSAGVSHGLFGVHFADGIWLISTLSGTVLTSSDATDWTERSVPTSQGLRSPMWRDGLWVVVGDSGTVVTSPDGVSWTDRSTPVSTRLQSVAYGAGRWVACGQSGTVISSTDGVSWSDESTPTSGELDGVDFGSGLFVAAGRSGTVISSTDGVSWSDESTPTSGDLTGGAAHGDGGWVASGAGGVVIVADSVLTGSGVVTLGAVDLPAACDQVYLLADDLAEGTSSVTYEATVDGGTTWEQVVEGEVNDLAHSGDSLAVRATLDAPDGDACRVLWLIIYATTA